MSQPRANWLYPRGDQKPKWGVGWVPPACRIPSRMCCEMNDAGDDPAVVGPERDGSRVRAAMRTRVRTFHSRPDAARSIKSGVYRQVLILLVLARPEANENHWTYHRSFFSPLRRDHAAKHKTLLGSLATFAVSVVKSDDRH